MASEGLRSTPPGRVLMTTHKVVIDVNDAEQASRLREALDNEGYRVHYEIRKTISRGGTITQEVEHVD